jgi:spoIIIJ-associated protein
VSEEINDAIVEEADQDVAAEVVADAEESVDEAASSGADGAADAEDGEDGEDGEQEAGDGATRSKKETVLENEGEIAADYLEELLDIADLDGDIDTFIEGGRAHVSIITEGDVLVGKDGEVLEALQELARLAVMTETGHRSRLMLDVAGHRDKRRKVLQDLAKDAVDEVNDTGEAVRLAPMNPFERKIVHDSVAAAGLVSESEGEEPQRRVVVLPKA